MNSEPDPSSLADKSAGVEAGLQLDMEARSRILDAYLYNNEDPQGMT